MHVLSIFIIKHTNSGGVNVCIGFQIIQVMIYNYDWTQIVVPSEFEI